MLKLSAHLGSHEHLNFSVIPRCLEKMHIPNIRKYGHQSLSSRCSSWRPRWIWWVSGAYWLVANRDQDGVTRR